MDDTEKFMDQVTKELELQNQIFVTIGGKAHSIPAIDSNKKTGQIIFEKRITIPPAQA